MKREMTYGQNGLVYEQWQGQFDAFAPFEFICGIPQPLFMITTYKDNGLANACFHSWSCFSGDAGGYYAILSALGRQSHTYRDIMRDRVFCVNFLSHEYYGNCMETIRHNSLAENEIAAGGFTLEECREIACPKIKESFLTLECKLEHDVDLSRRNIVSLIIGRVTHISMDEDYMVGVDRKYSEKGFMFNINSPVDFATGKCDRITSAYPKLFDERS